MSYEEERKKTIRESENMDDWDTEYDQIWLKMQNMADSFNRSIDIGNPNYVEGLNPIYFTKNDVLIGMLKYINSGRLLTYKEIPFNEDFLCTMPTTFPELFNYFFYYQNLVDKVYKGIFDRYELKDKHLVIIKTEKKPLKSVPTPQKIEILTAHAVPIALPAEQPPADQPQEDTDDLRIPPKATPETFKERKDNQKLYDKVNNYYIDALMPLYLDSLIKYIGKSYRVVAYDVPYRKEEGDYEDEYYSTARKGRGDFLNTHDGLFLIINKQQYQNVTMDTYLKQNFEEYRTNSYLKFSKYDGSVLEKFMRTANIKEILRDLMIESVTDILPYETNYAIDGSGFDASSQNDWYSFKHHAKKEHDWMYIVALVPTKTDVVALANLYYKYSSDETKEFKLIMDEVQERQIEIRSLCGDKLYSSKEFHNWMGDLGIQFYTEFRDDVSPPLPDDNSQWAKDYRFWRDHPAEFSKKYHTRSNVESTFSAIKNRCGEKLRSKTEGGFYSELFSKIIYYNLCHMILELFLNGIVPHYVDIKDIDAVLRNMKSVKEQEKERKAKESAEFKEQMESKPPKYLEDKGE